MPSNPTEIKFVADCTAKKSIPTRKVYGYYSVSTPLQPPKPLVESQGLGGTFINLTMHEADAACALYVHGARNDHVVLRTAR
eukprot:CAMPEP_0179468018 /NCGR_PEP_ID=MMETSP0799-20121207/49028_1 /TAXON_ID=46947 /ORGANISM="Geminigera cryophila, Strain CCMP2564" /LENGTH=81 /DNA_ID=CAMNT_0021273769 /DNA_START=22 /DNA_END=267 /DNA_ORIENTATION=+